MDISRLGARPCLLFLSFSPPPLLDRAAPEKGPVETGGPRLHRRVTDSVPVSSKEPPNPPGPKPPVRYFYGPFHLNSRIGWTLCVYVYMCDFC